MMLKAVVLFFLVVSASALSRQGAKEVEDGTEFFRDGDTLTIREPSGKVTVTQVGPSSHNKRDSGWISSVWTFSNYTYYSAVWKVPPTPAVSTNNILFFFNSFESNAYNDILQPVLQLNNGVAGWTLASWYGAGSDYYHSTPAPVSPGESITGVIQQINGAWDILGYVNGVLKAQITVSFSTVSAQGNAEFAMEVYNIDTCTQYPSSNRLDIGNIVLKHANQQVTPSFSKSINSNSCNAGADYTTTTAGITWSS